MQPVANWRVTSKIAQTSQVELPSNAQCHFIGTRPNPSPPKIEAKVLFCTFQAVFSGLILEDLKIQLGKSPEAEKIVEYLNDSPSVSAQSECVAFQLAERVNQAVIKTKFGARC